MGRKSNKSPQEQLAEAQNILRRAQERAAKEAASTNPEIAKLTSLADKLAKEQLMLERADSGHNSFENRLAAIEARKAWIEASRRFSDLRVEELKEQRQALSDALALAAQTVAAGEEISGDEIIAYLPSNERCRDAESEMNRADANWRSLTPSALAKASGSDDATKIEIAAE